MKLKKQAQDFIPATELEPTPPRWGAYVNGRFTPIQGKPVLVHVRGATPPFDAKLQEYWTQQHPKRVK